MMVRILMISLVVFAFAAPEVFASELDGTSWKLVKFTGGDDTVLTQADGVSHTISFAAEGKLSAQISCNRGAGTWSSAGPSQLKLGPLAVTMMACLKASPLDRIARDWERIVSYVLKDGLLFLSLMADGGIYEFEPAAKEVSIRGTITHRERIAMPPAAMVEVKILEVTKANDPGVVIAENTFPTNGKQVPIPFEIKYDAAKTNAKSRYVLRVRILIGENVMFRSTRTYRVINGPRLPELNVLVSRVRS